MSFQRLYLHGKQVPASGGHVEDFAELHAFVEGSVFVIIQRPDLAQRIARVRAACGARLTLNRAKRFQPPDVIFSSLSRYRILPPRFRRGFSSPGRLEKAGIVIPPLYPAVVPRFGQLTTQSKRDNRKSKFTIRNQA